MMVERFVFARIQRIPDSTLRGLAERLARLVLENWFFALVFVLLWRFPYIVADLSGSQVKPSRPTGDSAFWQSEMARALTLACLAMSYNLLFGFSGIVSFGHALFFGAGGYVTFILMGHYDAGLQHKALVLVLLVALGLALFSRLRARALVVVTLSGVLLALLLLPAEGAISFWQAAAVALLLSLIVSLTSGVVTLRVRGIYFAMFTLALAEVFWVLAKSGTFRSYTGAEDGLAFRSLLPPALNVTPTADGSRLTMYHWTVVFFAIIFLAIRRYMSSPVGRVMLAIRDNEERAQTIGYHTLFYKVLTMVFAGAIATLSGLLFMIWATDKIVHPDTLSLAYTVDPLLNTLIGGVGTLTGPVIATLGLHLGETYLRNETFTLGTRVFGLLAVWQIIALAIAGALVGVFRHSLTRLGERLIGAGPRTPRYERLMLAYRGGVFVTLAAVLLLIGGQLRGEAEAVYNVADLWDLFLGALFVVVVMVLPHGIVGTWNRLWATRRLRRLERQMRQEREAAGASKP
ncbi:MAG: branched-chain amino acid ABC transporter permease [Anaerolineae bacterium]|nr:branched-chain amino acid ABC transporter permease [Anaerolineae bacterium]